MKDWLTTDLKTYIERHKTGNGLFVFQHIPKTAGSSIVQEMSRHIGGYRGIFIDYTNLPAVGGVDDLMMESLKRFLAEYDPKTIRCASGHLRRSHVDHIASVLPDAKFCTFLRDPVDRVISDYRYQCTDQHPPYLEFRAKFPTIDDYVAVRGTGDKMWHFLVDDDVPLHEGIARIEKRFAFVGIKEMYAVSVNIMMLLNGVDAMPRVHVRPTKNIAENRVEVSDDLRARILETNQRDLALYEHFRTLLTARRDAWRAMKQEMNLERIEAFRRAQARSTREVIGTAV